MNILNVKIKAQEESSYPVITGQGLLEHAYEYIEKYTAAKKFLIVTNPVVYELYGKYLKHPDAVFCILPDGERYKTMEYLNKAVDCALENRLERGDAFIALGGGVIGDTAGFAASVYLRGIDFIQIPSTLLAQTDSSIGGKTAVNHRLGKNLIGAFYQPKLVLTDINTLNTLDERQFKTGLSEIIKYSFIEKNCGAEKFFNMLDFLKDNARNIKAKNPKTLEKLITMCCTLKSAVVNKDEKEKGLRAFLNFGHTYAHAVENITNYEKYTHGEAVSIGIKLIFDLALKLGRVDETYRNEALELLNEYGLITELDFKPDKEAFYNAMLSDKKVKDGGAVFVMPCARAFSEIVKNIDKKLVIQGI